MRKRAAIVGVERERRDIAAEGCAPKRPIWSRYSLALKRSMSRTRAANVSAVQVTRIAPTVVISRPSGDCSVRGDRRRRASRRRSSASDARM